MTVLRADRKSRVFLKSYFYYFVFRKSFLFRKKYFGQVFNNIIHRSVADTIIPVFQRWLVSPWTYFFSFRF